MRCIRAECSNDNLTYTAGAQGRYHPDGSDDVDDGMGIACKSHVLSYGWGVIPVRVRLGSLHFTTSLFPKGGSYLLPVKAEIRKKIGLMEGDQVTVELEVDA